jgi:DNA-binding protein H-NS
MNMPTPNGKDTKSALPAPADGQSAEDKARTALPFDWSTASDEEVAVAAVEAPRELERRRARVLRSLGEQARILGMSATRLAGWLRAQTAAEPIAADGPDGRTVVAPKYRDPATGATWSGRGEAPPWVEFGPDTLPPGKPGGKPRRVPLKRFWITASEQDK